MDFLFFEVHYLSHSVNCLKK